METRRAASNREFEQWLLPLLRAAAGYAYAILHRRQDAEEAVQEAVLKAYAARDRYDQSRSFKAWWFAIVRNCCLDILRRRSHSDAPDMDPADLPTPGNPAARLAIQDELAWALQQLSSAHREILELRYYGECAYDEIAQTLGIPVGTVMSRLHAARTALADAYRKENA